MKEEGTRELYCTYCHLNNHNKFSCWKLQKACLRCGSGEHFVRGCPMPGRVHNFRNSTNLRSTNVRTSVEDLRARLLAMYNSSYSSSSLSSDDYMPAKFLRFPISSSTEVSLDRSPLEYSTKRYSRMKFRSSTTSDTEPSRGTSTRFLVKRTNEEVIETNRKLDAEKSETEEIINNKEIMRESLLNDKSKCKESNICEEQVACNSKTKNFGEARKKGKKKKKNKCKMK